MVEDQVIRPWGSGGIRQRANGTVVVYSRSFNGEYRPVGYFRATGTKVHAFHMARNADVPSDLGWFASTDAAVDALVGKG